MLFCTPAASVIQYSSTNEIIYTALLQMVGVGTKDINLEGYSNVFCSLLGQNTESWGLSYQAHFHHGGQIWQYGGMFGQGSLLGIHLDCWNGTLSFYKNRRPLGENNVAI